MTQSKSERLLADILISEHVTHTGGENALSLLADQLDLIAEELRNQGTDRRTIRQSPRRTMQVASEFAQGRSSATLLPDSQNNTAATEILDTTVPTWTHVN